jgi:hypothetical protein
LAVPYPPRLFPPAARALLAALLCRDECSRLGAGPGGARDVMAADWFQVLVRV